jgi:HAE1 family hydrophobic/amphiphilic exporter-1
MGFARFSVTRPVAVTMRIAALVLLGFICLTKLSVDLLPAVTIPTVSVNTTWPNVAPEQMETQITRPVEEAVSQAPNLYEIDSSSTQGQSSVRCQFNWGTDVNSAAIDVLQLAQRARASFPQDPTNTLQVPLVFKFDPSALPILIMAVTGEDDPVKLRVMLDNEITPLFESANGVASAVATGGLPRAIIVDVDPTKLQAHGMSLDDVSNRLTQENIQLPAGIARQGNTEYTIRAVGYFTDPKQAAKIPLGVVNGQQVLLSDVATVRDQYQEQRVFTRLNGQPAAGMIITKQSAANTVSTAEAVLDKLKQVKLLYPKLKWSIAYDQSGFINDSINDLKNTAIIGGSLAVIILMLFLRNLRSTLVVALSIPTSVISTFAMFYFAGFTLNTISLSGLALATGLIVDDAVVVLENIFRHIERDKRRAADAAVVGSSEIASAVIASTFTVMIVFLPLMMIKGQAGQTFTQFALVVIFSMAVSLLDAMSVVPMLASRLIKEQEVLEEAHPELRTKKPGPITHVFDWFGARFNAMDSSYHNGLKWALAHRSWIIIGGVLATASAWLLYPFVGSELLPATDSGNFTVNMKLPVGTALATTNADMKQVEKIIMGNPNVATVFAVAGSTLSLRGTTTAQIGYQGGATVTLKENRKQSTQQVMAAVQRQLAKISAVQIAVQPYDLVTQILTGNTTNLEVDVFGQNYNELTAAAKEVQQKLQLVPGLDAVDLGVQEATPQLQVTVDRDKAAALGVTYTDIASTLNGATNGELSTYYQENGFQYPIYVQEPIVARKTAADLMNLPVTPSIPTPNGPKSIILGQVAKPFFALGPNQVTRLNRQRYIAVTGRVNASRSQSEVQADVQKALGSTNLGNGIRWDWGLSQRRQVEEFSGMGLAVFMAIALIYILLASQFESFIYPLIVLCSVPLCAVGVVLALFLTGRAFGLTAYIGILMLIGIVVKNGILLVDYTNQLRGRGMSRDMAILQAGPTRLRPILMTTCAAILGMLPLALQLGKGSETEAPLATAVIGGLSTSTMLTLFVVPVVYTFFDDLARKFRHTDKDLAAPNIVGPSVESTEHLVQPNGGTKAGHEPIGSELHE